MRRLFAWAIDCAVVIAVLSLPVFDGLDFLLGISLEYALMAVYFALFCGVGTGATPGQRLFGIAVQPATGSRVPPGRAFIRGAVKAVVPFLAATAVVQGERRGVHDFLAGTVVMVTRDPRPVRVAADAPPPSLWRRLTLRG